MRDTGSLLTVCLEEVCPSLKEALAHREGLTELPRRMWTHSKYAVREKAFQGEGNEKGKTRRTEIHRVPYIALTAADETLIFPYEGKTGFSSASLIESPLLNH